MRKISVQTFLTLDGVMQAPGGPGEDNDGGFNHEGWSVNYWDDEMGHVMGEAMAEPYDLLLGRRTYDIFAAHWPRAGDDPVAVKFNAATKYVATSSPDTLEWKNSVALTGNVAERIARLKRSAGPNLSVQGSSQLIQTLIAHDLVDEFRLMIFPLILGPGKRLFGSGAMPAGLTLVEHQTSSTGVMMNVYRRAEMAKIGTFALDPAREKASQL